MIAVRATTGWHSAQVRRFTQWDAAATVKAVKDLSNAWRKPAVRANRSNTGFRHVLENANLALGGNKSFTALRYGARENPLN